MNNNEVVEIDNRILEIYLFSLKERLYLKSIRLLNKYQKGYFNSVIYFLDFIIFDKKYINNYDELIKYIKNEIRLDVNDDIFLKGYICFLKKLLCCKYLNLYNNLKQEKDRAIIKIKNILRRKHGE